MVFDSRTVGCPIVTPFTDGAVDHDALADLAATLVERGVEVLVPCGTTGEFSSLTPAERRRVVETVVDAAPADVPVAAGASATAVEEVRDRLEEVADAGADAALVLPPYFLGGDAAGSERFFRQALADSPLPVYLYNIPSVAGTTIDVDVVAALADHESVVGIKDSSGDVSYVSSVVAATPTDFHVLEGYDGQLAPGTYVGMTGGINALSHFVPDVVRAVVEAVENGDRERATRLQRERIDPLFEACLDFGFAPATKTLLAEQGVLPTAEVRPPLSLPDGSEREALVERVGSM